MTKQTVFAAPDQLILDFCALQKDMKCPLTFADEIAPIEKKFLTMKQSYANKPIALVAAQVDRMLGMAHQTESTQLEELKTRYLRRRLEQWQKEIREKMETISVWPKLISKLRSSYPDDKQFLQSLRQYILPGLVNSGFAKFSKKPYGGAQGVYVDKDWKVIVDALQVQDDLDKWLQTRWKNNKTQDSKTITLYLKPADIDRLNFVYLFKNKQDLDALWYQLISNRERVNTDEGYRRFNIKTAFEKIWPVRVVMPWETISFLHESQFDMDRKELYKWWKVISSDEEVDDYGGGLCGAATAIYQWTVTNQWLSPKMRNHSKWYRGLYTATIDGQRQALPGVDATIYSPSLDFTLTNTRKYPIIISMNFDGEYKWLESVFTLGKSGDHGSLEYVGKRNYTATLNVKWWWKKSVTGQCHSRLINGKKQERCYKEIK